MDVPDARAVLGEYAETRWRCAWEGKAVGVNRKYIVQRGARRLVLSPEYRAFKEGLTWAFKICAPKRPFSGQIPIAFRFRLAPRMDFDAIIKPVADALQDAGVIENDRQIRGHIGVYVEDKGRGESDRVEVEIG